MQKLVLNPIEWDYIRHLGLETKTEEFVDEWMERTFVKAYSIEQIELMERLRGPASEHGNRVATNPEIPRLRGLGVTANQVFFDEAVDTKADYFRWHDGDASSEWLEHRVLCTRDVLACLSRESCSGG